MVKELYMVRHGQTAWNLEQRIQGQTDRESGLTETGRSQARDTGKGLLQSGVAFDRAYSSDLRRARETAEEILPYLGDVPVEYTSGLRERNFGSLQGKTVQEAGFTGYLGSDYYHVDQEGIMADAEPLSSIEQRAKRFIQTVLDSEDSIVLVIGHVWINSYISNALLREGYVFHRQSNASIRYFKLDDDGTVLEHR